MQNPNDHDFDATHVLFVGDIHGHVGHLGEAVGKAIGMGYPFDAIVQLGDFGVWPGPKGAGFLDKVSDLALDLQIPILFIGGNHEDYNQINEWDAGDNTFYEVREGLYYIPRGTRWEWGGQRFGALGGAFSVDCEWRTRDESWWPVAEELAVADIKRLGAEKLDFLLGHDTGYLAVPGDHWKFQIADSLQLVGSITQYLTQLAIDATNPKFYLHGHWHVPIHTTLHDRGNRHLDTQCVGLSSRDGQNMHAHPDQTWVVFDVPSGMPHFGKLWNPIQNQDLTNT